ncbi:MAG TPA: alpha/beta fold hydrolase [Candidatus Saccharimonadales bacterium]|nr:alpha/beta fold hydrolase [Candidatus Saccharimonadales bacterium]
MIRTPSFEIAEYATGDQGADRLALVLPGRLDTKDYPHMRSHVDFLASLGYYALSFDAPGSWESGGGIEIYSMTNYLKAIDELIEHFGHKPTLLLGHSRGGSVAMLAAPKNPAVTGFVSVFSRATPSTIGADKAKEQGMEVEHRDIPGHPDQSKEFALPYSYFEDAAQYNALQGLQTFTKPKLFFYGTRDELVRPAEVRKAYEASADPKEIHELDSDHDYRWHPEIIEQVNAMVKGWAGNSL